MKLKFKGLISLILSALVTLMCISSTVFAATSSVKSNKRMTWYIKSANAVPGDDVRIDIIAENPVALKSFSDIGFKCDAPIQPIGMSERCETYNGTITTSISGNTMMFGMNGSNPSAGTNFGVIFSAYFHVPENCPAGKYYINWISSEMNSETPSGSAYFPLLREGSITVGSGSSTGTTTTTTTTSTTTTTTTTTSTSTTTTTTTTTTTITTTSASATTSSTNTTTTTTTTTSTTSSTSTTTTTTTTSTTTSTSSSSSATTTDLPDKAYVILEQPEASQLYAGNSVNLNYYYSDGSAFSGNVWFESDNWNVAGVSDNKVLNINSAGTAVITINAMLNDGSVVRASITINATEHPVQKDYILGDVNGDQVVDASDATLVLREYTVLLSNGASTLNEIQKLAANADGSNNIDASDATLILRYYTISLSTLSGSMPSFEEWLKTV